MSLVFISTFTSSLVLFAGRSFAQSEPGYTSAYSGGTCDPSAYGNEDESTEDEAETGYILPEGGDGGIAGIPEQYGEEGDAECSGEITDTLTWNGGADSQPAPSAVIVEKSSAAFITIGEEDEVGNVDDGLGDSIDNTSSSVGVSGFVYTSVANPGSTFPESCTPTASVASSPDSGGECNAAVGFAAIVYPVSIDLVGPTPDSSGNEDILVGQHCTASISVGTGTDGSTFPTSWITSYSWSVSGTTFQTWQSTTPSTPGPANANASYYVGGPGVLTNPTDSWYWNDASATTETVTCTATVTPPTGEGSSFSVTASQTVDVLVPTWSGTASGGSMQVNASEPANGLPGGNPSDIWLWAGPTTGESGGMNWSASVTAPSAPGITFGSGSLELVQLIIPSLTYTNSGDTYSYSLDGEQGLDTTCPYPWVDSSPNYATNDNPGIDLTLTGASSATIGDQFQDYLMYEPPGSNSQYVPLGYFSWDADGDVSEPGGGWSDFTGSAGSVSPSSGTFASQNTFPSWTRNSGNGEGSF